MVIITICMLTAFVGCLEGRQEQREKRRIQKVYEELINEGWIVEQPVCRKYDRRSVGGSSITTYTYCKIEKATKQKLITSEMKDKLIDWECEEITEDISIEKGQKRILTHTICKSPCGKFEYDSDKNITVNSLGKKY